MKAFYALILKALCLLVIRIIPQKLTNTHHLMVGKLVGLHRFTIYQMVGKMLLRLVGA